jgi:hydroxycarboxylate dehydrogenase B
MPVIAAAALTEVADRIVRCSGSAEAEAHIVAEHLVGANLSGHDSHGVGMLSPYMRNFHNGLLIPNTAPATIRV